MIQHTINKELTIKGVGLHSGKNVNIKLKPLPRHLHNQLPILAMQKVINKQVKRIIFAYITSKKKVRLIIFISQN